MLSHCTGGRQQGWEQASEQVEYHWGGNNSLDSSAAQRGLTKSGTGVSMWICISGQDMQVFTDMVQTKTGK